MSHYSTDVHCKICGAYLYSFYDIPKKCPQTCKENGADKCKYKPLKKLKYKKTK